MVRQYSKADLRVLSTEGLSAELPAPPAKRKSEEFQLQVALVAWWKGYCVTQDIPEFLLWHTPNGTMHSGSKENRARVGAMMKRAGCRGGVPDIALMVPRLQLFTKGYNGLFLELKAANGVLSIAQTEMLAALQERGYQTATCWTLEDAQQVITDYLK